MLTIAPPMWFTVSDSIGIIEYYIHDHTLITLSTEFASITRLER